MISPSGKRHEGVPVMEPNAEATRAEERGGDAAAKPADGSRWTAAVGYVAFMCFFALWRARRDGFIRAHASQAVLLFIAECAAVAASIILAGTVGKIKFAGMIVVGVFDLVAGLAALMLSLAGFIKALFGEDWKMPFLGQLRERVPGFHEEG